MTDDAPEHAEPVDGDRRPRTALLAAIPVLVVLGFLVYVFAGAEPSTSREVNSPLIGKRAPNIAGTTIDGEPFDLASYRGDFVVVNFFATWCTPCIREHDDLMAFHDAHAAGDAIVVSVVYDDSTDAAIEFFDRFGGDWPVVVDPVGRVALDYGVIGVPESFFVTPDGVVAAKLLGGVDVGELEALLARLQGAA